MELSNTSPAAEKPMMNDIELQATVHDMDIPAHRQDVSRAPNIVWLLENMGRRNSTHKKFRVAVQALLSRARTQNLMKASELARTEQKLLKEETVNV